jgi:hypothetical protein
VFSDVIVSDSRRSIAIPIGFLQPFLHGGVVIRFRQMQKKHHDFANVEGIWPLYSIFGALACWFLKKKHHDFANVEGIWPACTPFGAPTCWFLKKIRHRFGNAEGIWSFLTCEVFGFFKIVFEFPEKKIVDSERQWDRPRDRFFTGKNSICVHPKCFWISGEKVFEFPEKKFFHTSCLLPLPIAQN